MNTEHTTQILLRRARDGDDEAMNALAARYLVPLQQWAASRLPRDARDMMDTEDIVQESFYRAIPHLQKLEDEGRGAVLAYMRQTVLNMVRNELKRAGRHPRKVEPDANLRGKERSPLDELLGKETAERYEAAMSTLTPLEREAVVMRIEFGYRYRDIAVALGRPSASAARMMIGRALNRVALHMSTTQKTVRLKEPDES